MSDQPLSPRDRLLYAVAHATGTAPPLGTPLWSVPLTEPASIHRALSDTLGRDRAAVVTATLDRRLVLIKTEACGQWIAADLSGQPHRSRTWPDWTAGHLNITDPDNWCSPAQLTTQGLHRLLRPRLLLASLYHPKYFRLPRFPLAISDLARAARATLLGQVDLMDMQLGVPLAEIIKRAASGNVDILGVSATFGQHDLMVELLDAVTSCASPPLVVAGGCLTVRNERILLERYPQLIIGRDAGQLTIADILGYWHGDVDLKQVRGAGYRGAPRGQGTLWIGRVRHTATVANRVQAADVMPELDLLHLTFQHRGVVQLETSPGRTNYCSLCPRGDKGQWDGATPEALPRLLAEMGAVFDQHPDVSRTVYVVDDEFIGRDGDAVSQALDVAAILADARFAWETSCRVDQVARPDTPPTDVEAVHEHHDQRSGH